MTSMAFLLVALVVLPATEAARVSSEPPALPVVHLIPHSHSDAGYRESFIQYYNSSVNKTLHTMLEALGNNSNRTFVWEESSFLSQWWMNDANDEQKELMKKLINEGRLEMIGGGWTMHDEANNNAATIIEEMTFGLNFLRDNLKVRPKHEWHIDPFGHSLMMPELYSALQYKAIVINRIPDPIKQQMKKDKGLEFWWKSSFTNTQMFTHVLDSHYSTPKIEGSTTEEKAKSLVDECLMRLAWYRTDQLLVPFGGDFTFEKASEQFSGMEKIVDYVNNNSDTYKLKIRFSTLDDYFSVVMSMDQPTFPVLTDVDFFPYIACYPCFSDACVGKSGSSDVPCGIQTPGGYWSGYFTSKPAQKLLIREQEASLRVVSTLTSLYPFLVDDAYSLYDYNAVQALLTHHDAITGTSFPPAYDDYNHKLLQSLAEQRSITGMLQDHILCGKVFLGFNNDTVARLNRMNDSNVGVVSVFNPLMKTRYDYARIELPKDLCVKVSSSSGKALKFQQIGSMLYVPLSVGPLEMQTLFLSKSQCSSKKSRTKFVQSFSNGYLQVMFDENNHITSLKNVKTHESIDLSLIFTEVFEQKSSTVEEPHSVCDGTNVYTFVPNGYNQSFAPNKEKIATVITSDGPLVWEVQQTISAANSTSCPIHMTVRLFSPIEDDKFFQQFIEVQNTVGPLEEEYPNSIMFSVNSSLSTSDTFTTYTSGLYSMKRQYNHSKLMQGNFYPLVGRVSMKDDKKDLAIVISTKRPMAVSGKDGTLDLLFHRRIKLDNDPRGNDTAIMADPVYLGVTDAGEADAVSYDAMSLSQHPLAVYAVIAPSKSHWTDNCNSTFTPLKTSLPKGVMLHSMTLLEKPTSTSDANYKVGLRLVNIGSDLAEFELSKMFSNLRFISAIETSPDFAIVHTNLVDGTLKAPPYKLMSVLMTLYTD